MTFSSCFAACVVEFKVLFYFDPLCLTEVMAEDVLSKVRGIPKVYLRHAENSSKEVNVILDILILKHFYLIVISIQLFV